MSAKAFRLSALRAQKRTSGLVFSSGGIGLERLTLVSVLETERLRWLCRTRVSKVVDLARHLRVCLACIEGLRRLSINFVDNRALEYIHEPRRWV